MNFVQVKEKPQCWCGHNERWHAKTGECLAVTCECEQYVSVREIAPARLERVA